MSRLTDLPTDLLEMLSAALDGSLDPKAQAALQARLKDDERLRRAQEELREVRAGMGLLPSLRVPRNFTVTPEMVGQRAARPAYPALRLATALAALAFVLTFGLDSFAVRFAALPAALPASAPAEGIAAEAPPQAAAELMLESAALPGTIAPNEGNAEAERSAADALATATALPPAEPALKAGEVGQEATAEAPAVAQPASTQPAQSVPPEPDQAMADALDEAPQQETAATEDGWTPRPLQLVTAALGMLTIVLGWLALRARQRA